MKGLVTALALPLLLGAAGMASDTKAWSTHTFKLAPFGFTEAGPGGADLWLDDLASDPLIVDQITVTDQDPDVTHFPHVDPAHPIKIDGVITEGEWDGAYTVTLN